MFGALRATTVLALMFGLISATPSNAATYTFPIGATVFGFPTNGEAGTVSVSFNFTSVTTPCPECGFIYNVPVFVEGINDTREVGNLFASRMNGVVSGGSPFNFSVLATDVDVLVRDLHPGFGFACGGPNQVFCGPTGTVIFQFDPFLTVAQVPLPASLPLLVLGVGGLAYLGLRKRQRSRA